MKAIVLDRPGTPDILRLAEMPIPKPQVGEVRVKVHATGLNPADYKFAARGFRTWEYPFILGLDAAGTIDAVGEGVTDWQVGDAVYYHANLSKPGTFAEYHVNVAHTLAHKPVNLSFAEAAALPCAGWTAYQALHRKLHIQSGQTILVHGGSGGVGGFAIQLARQKGLRIISTCSSVNFDFVRQLGADNLIDYHTEDVALKVKEITQGRGVDAILDTVSSASATIGLDLLAFGGAIACVAGLPDLSGWRGFSKAISVHDLALGGAYLSGDLIAQNDLAKIGEEFGQLVTENKLNSLLTETIALEKIPIALAELKQGVGHGKKVAKLI